MSESAQMVFIHVQKTGGLSTTTLLLDALPDARRLEWMRDGRHATLSTVLRARPQYSDYFVFGFVRNPWARMWSWHSMVMRRAQVVPDRVAKNPFWNGVVERYPDFESFVLEGPREFGRLRRPQLDYLRTEDREADFIGRTESLTTDMAAIGERLGLTLPEGEDLPRHNAGPSVSYRDHYTTAMRDRVASIYAPDIEKFGYEF